MWSNLKAIEERISKQRSAWSVFTLVLHRRALPYSTENAVSRNIDSRQTQCDIDPIRTRYEEMKNSRLAHSTLEVSCATLVIAFR